MTDRQPTVIDGETVDEPTETPRRTHKSDNTARPDAQRKGRADWIARLLALIAAFGFLWLSQTRPDLTPLIETQNTFNSRLQALEDRIGQPDARISTLEKQLAELKDTVEALSTEVDALNEKVLNPANAPLVTRGEVEQLRKQLDGFQTQLQQLARRWQDTLQQMTQPDDSGSQPPDAASPPALNQLKQQLEQMGRQLGQLFGKLTETPDKTPAGDPNGLDPMTLQQWLLKVNAEWLLTADVAQTRQRLHALEKAVQLSDLPDESKIALLRAIGQDLAYLDHFARQPRADAHALAPFRQWIRQLPPPKAGTSDHAPAHDADLMNRLKGLVEIRRRDEGPSTPERLMTFDLTRQRALLLVDQLAWAYTTRNRALFDRTRQRLIDLFQRALPERLSALRQQLDKLPSPVTPQPLKSAEAL